MEAVSLDTIMQLSEPAPGLRVSIFMPTQRFGPGSQEADSTRLKNLTRKAQAELEAQGLKTGDAERLLAPARALLDDRPFWLRSREGLGVLLGDDDHHVFRLDVPTPEHVHVSRRYWVRPLLPLVDRKEAYWVLALSQKRVRLLKGDRSSLTEVPTEHIPESLSDALQWEDFEKSSLQFHTGTSGTGGRRPAVFHGTGEPDTKGEIIRFFREIDRGLHEHLGSDHAPLVLAGVDYLIPLYHEVSTCPHLLAGAVTGSPDAPGDQSLHERSWDIAAEAFGRDGEQILENVREDWASARVTTEPQYIREAAAAGRIGSLLISETAGWWSDDETGSGIVQYDDHPDADEDLLQTAALDTLANGGEVLLFAADRMPHEARAVALLRY